MFFLNLCLNSHVFFSVEKNECYTLNSDFIGSVIIQQQHQQKYLNPQTNKVVDVHSTTKKITLTCSRRTKIQIYARSTKMNHLIELKPY